MLCSEETRFIISNSLFLQNCVLINDMENIKIMMIYNADMDYNKKTIISIELERSDARTNLVT